MRVAFALLLLPTFIGCTMFSKTEIARENEVERAVKFETRDAEDVFREAVKKHHVELSRTEVGGPILTLYESSKVLSEPACFNDAVIHCDTNRDGAITLREAAEFDRVKRQGTTEYSPPR